MSYGKEKSFNFSHIDKNDCLVFSVTICKCMLPIALANSLGLHTKLNNGCIIEKKREPHDPEWAGGSRLCCNQGKTLRCCCL